MVDRWRSVAGIFQKLSKGSRVGQGESSYLHMRHLRAPVFYGKTFLYQCWCVGKLVGMIVTWHVKSSMKPNYSHYTAFIKQ